MLKSFKKYKFILIDKNSLNAKEINAKSIFLVLSLSFVFILTFLFISLFSTNISEFLSFK